MAEIPPALSGAFEGSFAYKTIRDRMPTVLVRIIDDLHKLQRQQVLEHGQSGADGLKDTIGRLSKLRYEMMTNKDIAELAEDGHEDIALWNAYLGLESAAYSSPPRWFQNAWLFVECYMYRKINEIMHQSQHLQDFDPFRAQKNVSLADSTSAVKVLLEHTHQVLMKPVGNDAELKAIMSEYIELSLWGNKCDLSITGGADNAQKANPLEQLAALRRYELINDFEHFWLLLASARATGGTWRMDIVLDNAGFELVTDLALAELLLALGFTRTVYLHVKRMPWFVSDATRQDLMHTLDQLASSRTLAVRTLGERWIARLHEGGPSSEAGTFVVSDDVFWTLPHDYSKMAAVGAGLYEDLTRSSLIVFKGDLNYRKLVGDRQWPCDVPFATALRDFAPAPLLSLRTLKADVVVGLASGVAEALGRGLDGSDWMTSGTYGVVQLHRSVSTGHVNGASKAYSRRISFKEPNSINSL